MAEKTILVTGGAGFIGANFVLDWLGNESAAIVNLDKLTYAGNLGSLQSVRNDPRHVFVHGDICDSGLVTGLLEKYRPSAIVHFAAESHVDRSIHGPEDFIQTNVVGTFRLLDAAREYFSKSSPYAPNSPYSASKAASDHLARAYFHTYGLPVVTTNCSNNYGPCQFPEKLIPVVILNALAGKPLPVYGDGQNVR